MLNMFVRKRQKQLLQFQTNPSIQEKNEVSTTTTPTNRPMTEAKEKDRILAQIKAFRPHGEIAGLEKHLDELAKDGYVSVSFATDGSIITIRITPQGERFLDNGGYTARYRADRKSKLSAKTWAAIGAVGGSVLTELIHILVERLAK